MFKSASRYAKFLVAVAGAIATWASSTFPDDASVQKWVGLALAIVTAISVYSVPNQPPAGAPADPNMSEQGQDPTVDPQTGTTTLGVILAVLVLIFALALGFTASHFWLLLLIVVVLALLL